MQMLSSALAGPIAALGSAFAGPIGVAAAAATAILIAFYNVKKVS
jgi:hypothetical protein